MTAARLKTHVLTCHARHPDPSRRGVCGHELGDVVGPVRFVVTSTKQPGHVHGRIRRQCARRDCRMWNVFEAEHE